MKQLIASIAAAVLVLTILVGTCFAGSATNVLP